MANIRFCNCNEYKEKEGNCRHLPPFENSYISSNIEENGDDKLFKPLCNCDEWRHNSGTCKHIPPWLSPTSPNESIHTHPSVELYPTSKRQKLVGEDAGPFAPFPRPEFLRFCNCHEFKSNFGCCKHLPSAVPGTHPLTMGEMDYSRNGSGQFQPLCNCDEWKRSDGVCKHIPPWLLHPGSNHDGVLLYNPDSRARGNYQLSIHYFLKSSTLKVKIFRRYNCNASDTGRTLFTPQIYNRRCLRERHHYKS